MGAVLGGEVSGVESAAHGACAGDGAVLDAMSKQPFPCGVSPNFLPFVVAKVACMFGPG